MGRLDYSEFPINLARDVEGEYLATGTEKCKLLACLIDKEVENLDDHDWPKDQDLVEEEWICSNYPFRHKTTLHCGECKVKLFGK